MFEGDTMVVYIVNEEGGTFSDILVRLRLDKIGILLNTYTFLSAYDDDGNPIDLPQDKIIEAETVADLLYWGIA